MTNIKKSTILTIAVVAAFIGIVAGFSFFLSSKTSERSSDSKSHQKQNALSNDGAFYTLMNNKAPDFTLADYQGKEISLFSQKGKNVLLFFTEGAMCYPACWNQIAEFGKDNDLKADNLAVYVITVEAKSDWKRAFEKMPELTSSTILFDTTKKVSEMYGVLTLPSSMHRGQFPGHTYVLIDKDGVVRYLLDDVQMGVRNSQLKAEISKLN